MIFPRAAATAAVLAVALGLACERKPPPPPPDLASSLAAIVATSAVVVGDVEVKRAGKQEWSRITTGAVLRVGDTVRTLARGFARLEFLKGSGIELEENTTVVIDLSKEGVASGKPGIERVSIEGGVARGFFDEKAGVEIGPIAIRTLGGKEATLSPGGAGVKFRLTATPTGTEIAVTSGTARVVTRGGEVALGAGRAVDLAGESIAAPVDLIEFPRSLQPGVDARMLHAPGLAVAFTWAKVAAATGYRLQVSRDLSFRELAFSQDVTDTTASFAPPTPGMYAWRVASRDGTGRYGEYGFARRVYCDERPREDLLVAPARDAQVQTEGATARVRFAWRPEPGARGYRLVISSGPELTERELRSTSSAVPSAQVEGLAPGTYFWGVYVDDERRDPLFVAPRRLVVKKPVAVRVDAPRSIRTWGVEADPPGR